MTERTRANPEQQAGVFIEHLQRSVTKRIFALIAAGVILFTVSFYVADWNRNTTRARENLAMLKQTYDTLYRQSMDFLGNQGTTALFLQKYSDPRSPDFSYAFNRFNSGSIVGNRYILTDEAGNLLEHDFPEEEATEYLINYNRAVCHNAGRQESGNIYVSVYFDTGKYADYMFVKPVWEDGDPKGYISLFVLGEDWNYYLSDRNDDGVIIDARNNVIYRSKRGFADASGKFFPSDKTICTYNGERYWQKKEYLPGSNVTICSLVYNPRDNTVLIGAVMLLLTGFLWYHIANRMSRTMAVHNAENIARLVAEIRIIQDGAHDHRITMESEDEFGEVAHRINRMLDSVQELNAKNAELLMLNATLEMGQLEAQMNPHFLYNTLEVVRNLVTLDAGRAELLIEKLVQILRYSVDTSIRDVHLREDMEYIDAYLYIQKIRYGDRLHYTVELPEACMECVIPKLLLQPLIENSIKYGFQKRMNLEIRIRGDVSQNVLTLCVEDNGGGMPETRAVQMEALLYRADYREKSLGIHNIARRLRLQYGERSGLYLDNHAGSGLTVLLKVEQGAEPWDG